MAVALAGRLSAAQGRPAGPLRRHRDGYRLGDLRAPDATGPFVEPQPGLDDADPGLSPNPSASRALLVGNAGAVGGCAGLHDELRRRRHADRGDSGPHSRDPRALHWRQHLVRVGGAPALSVRAGAPQPPGHRGFPGRAGYTEGDSGGYEEVVATHLGSGMIASLPPLMSGIIRLFPSGLIARSAADSIPSTGISCGLASGLVTMKTRWPAKSVTMSRPAASRTSPSDAPRPLITFSSDFPSRSIRKRIPVV